MKRLILFLLLLSQIAVNCMALSTPEEHAAGYLQFCDTWNIMENAADETYIPTEEDPFVLYLQDCNVRALGEYIDPMPGFPHPSIGMNPDYPSLAYHPDLTIECAGVIVEITEIFADPYKMKFVAACTPTADNAQARPMDCLYPYAPFYVPLSYYEQDTYFVEVLAVVNQNKPNNNGAFGLSDDHRTYYQSTDFFYELEGNAYTNETIHIDFYAFVGHYDGVDFRIETGTASVECPVLGFTDVCVLDDTYIFEKENLVLDHWTIQISPSEMYQFSSSSRYYIDTSMTRDYSFTFCDQEGQLFTETHLNASPYRATIPDPLYLCIYRNSDPSDMKVYPLYREGNSLKIVNLEE